MKKSEKIITACLTILLGVLLMVLKQNLIGVILTIAGVGLIVLGILDLLSRAIPFALIKMISGIFIIILGWVLWSIVLKSASTVSISRWMFSGVNLVKLACVAV